MKTQSYKVKKRLRFTKNASVIGAAVGSVPVVFIVAQGAAFNYLHSHVLSVIIGVLAVGLFAAVVEYGMKVYFPYGISGLLSGKAFANGWRQAALILIISGLGIAMMFASGYMSFEGRKEAANLVAGQTNTANIDQVAANISQSEKELLQVARSEKAAIQKQIAQREQQIKQANANLAGLVSSGNAWAANKLQRMIDTDPKLKRLETALNEQSKTITTLLQGSGVSKAVEVTAKENELKLQTWEQRRNTSAGLVGIFGIACILIFAFSATTLELFDIVEGTDRGTVTGTDNKRTKSVPTDIIPVSGASATTDRKADAALKQAYQNRSDIEQIKRSEPVIPVESRGNTEQNKKAGTGTDKRICQNRTCKKDLDKLGKRRDARFCSPACKSHHHKNK